MGAKISHDIRDLSYLAVDTISNQVGLETFVASSGMQSSTANALFLTLAGQYALLPVEPFPIGSLD